MTVKEVVTYLRMHTSTVYPALKRGRLPTFKIGSDRRFNLESIERCRLEQEHVLQVRTPARFILGQPSILYLRVLRGVPRFRAAG